MLGGLATAVAAIAADKMKPQASEIARRLTNAFLPASSVGGTRPARYPEIAACRERLFTRCLPADHGARPTGRRGFRRGCFHRTSVARAARLARGRSAGPGAAPRRARSRRRRRRGTGTCRYPWYGASIPMLPVRPYLPRSITRAAFNPAAPITPPPGWAAAPHRYNPRTGVA